MNRRNNKLENSTDLIKDLLFLKSLSKKQHQKLQEKLYK